MRVLIVEDEEKLAALIARFLREGGMAVDVAATGEDALWMAGATAYDAIMLDVGLPGIDGFEVCRRLRAEQVWAPILILTSRDAVPDRVAGAFVQVLDGDGAVAGTTAPELATAPVLPPDRLRAHPEGGVFDVRIPALGEDLRLATAPAEDDGVVYTVIVGASLQPRAEALADLREVLLVGGPIALLLAALAGYGVAAGALRPVEHMRARAAELFASGDTGRRLPVPPARDEIAGLGATLNEMLARVEAALERERAFTADAGHELRTPLSILKAEIDLALQDGRSREELVEALRSASEETDRLTRLAEDLLVLARADGERLPISVEPVEIGVLAQRVGGRFATRAGAAGRDLAVDADGADGALVTADPMRIDQALSNLIDNALRHGDGDVAVHTVRRDGRVEVHVTDQGPGFPGDLGERAFGRFVRGGGPGRGGAGLGLSIVDAIARAHGGSAGAGNLPGGGADVWMSLPAAPS